MTVLAVLLAILIFIVQKTFYSYSLTFTHMPLQPVFSLFLDRGVYALIYPLGGFAAFHVMRSEFFPEKRFTLKSPDRSFLKMLFYTLISVAALIVFMLVFDFFAGSKNQNLSKPFSDPSLFILFSMITVFITPVIEEFYYRGILGKFIMENLGAEAGLFLQALLFSLAHGNETIPVIFAVGIAAGIMYVKFGLKGSIIMHSFYNALILLFASGMHTGTFS